MYINIKKLLKQKGKSMYWLAKTTGISYPTIHNLVNNKTESIKFEVIEKICSALNCTPNDLLIINGNEDHK